MNHGKKAKKRLSAPNISLKLDRSDGSLLSDELDESTEFDLDGIDTPSDNSNEFEWEGEHVSEHALSLFEDQRRPSTRRHVQFSALKRFLALRRSDGQVAGCHHSNSRNVMQLSLCFHTAALPFFHTEEMFPLSGWEQVAGQRQVGLSAVVRCLETSFHLSCILSIHPFVQSSSDTR